MAVTGRTALLQLLGAAVCWSFAGSFIHYLSVHLSIITQSAWRYLFAGAALFILCGIVFRKELRMGRPVFGHMLLASLSGTVFQLCWVKALYLIKPGSASLIAELGTVLNILVLSLFYREERRTAKSGLFIASTVVMLSGALMIVIFHPAAAFDFNLGALFVVCSSLCWGFYNVELKKVLDEGAHPVAAMAYIALFISGFHFLVSAFAGNPAEFLSAPPRIMLIVAVSGVVSIAASFSLYHIAVNRVGALISNNSLMLISVLACVWSYFLFDERLVPLQIAGGVLLLFGGYLTSRVEYKKE